MTPAAERAKELAHCIRHWVPVTMREVAEVLETLTKELTAATERATKAEQELQTCRVALEKTRVEADRVIDEVALSRAVVDQVRYLQRCCWEYVRAGGAGGTEGAIKKAVKYLEEMPLPPKEKTT